ncbi:MAG TPA: cysteine desulfurase [Flavobacteriales bacterium]|jgi:cysteine desulfurase|nr:cysteine desulfurase [Flavobacteriales bacterium]
MGIYLDNAATTALDEEVIQEMLKYMREDYGNPSSTHSFGRKSRASIDLGRRKVAQHINAEPGEIVFTSGGTEADNMAILCSVEDLGVKHIITSSIEHHAVLYPVEKLAANGKIRMSLVNLDEKGHIDLDHLEELLKTKDKTLVTLLHANNEIGNLLPLKQVSDLCKKYDALLHADTVQTIAHYKLDVKELGLHFMTCAAHKFHGPKGIGFLYISNDVKVKPLILGGGQERNMRAGTENVYGIMGLVKALDLAYEHLEEHTNYIKDLKFYMIKRLREEMPGVEFNGDAEGDCLYTVLNVALPETDKTEMLLFNLDIEGIATSGGSACSSGSSVGSHVVAELNVAKNRPVVRFSFSKYNNKEEIDFTIEKLKLIYELPLVS